MIGNAIGQSDSIISIQQFRAGIAFTASLPGAPRTRNPYRHFVAVFITYIRVVGARREGEAATGPGRDGPTESRAVWPTERCRQPVAAGAAIDETRRSVK